MRAELKALALCMALVAPARALAYPVQVKSCNDMVTFAKAPERGLATSADMVQTVADLGLTNRFVGFSLGRSLPDIVASPADKAFMKRREMVAQGAHMEGLLGFNPDFAFTGWSYGMSQANGVTPANLAGYGVKTYVLSESCIRIGPRAPVSMETTYADILALGRIFGIEARAQTLVADQRRRIRAVETVTARAGRRVRMMHCSCASSAAPGTSGGEGMIDAIMTEAGGENIFHDVRDSWIKVSWEEMVKRDPEWLVLSTSAGTPEQIVAYLTSSPALKDVTAVKKRHFIFVNYLEVTPSTRNVDLVERMARTIHPELFKP